MLYQYQSTSLKTLQAKLQLLQSTIKEKDAFSQRWIVVQNREMEQWLTLNEAAHTGISANNQFIFPLELVWKLYRLKDDSIPKALPFDLVPMQWRIFSLLINDSALLQGHELDASSLDNERLFQVSASLADVFDLYQVFRPELLLKWQNGKSDFGVGDEVWQAKIWLSLRKSVKENNLPSRAEALIALINWLETNQFPIEKLPKSLYVFGVSQISQPFGNLLAALSKKIDVHLFKQTTGTPNSESDWAEFTNKLIKPAVDQEIVLTKSHSRFGIPTNIEVLDEESSNETSFLGGIQQELLGNTQIGLQQDSTFTIHSCHSIKREVEELKESLLSVMNTNRALKPEDILILVPDINDYNPTLEQVFLHTNGDTELPIATGIRASKPANIVFEQLINQIDGDFKATEILSILEHPAISNTLEMSDIEVSILRKWIVELRVRRGKDAGVYSWLHGLNNLILGYAMEGDEYESMGEYIPFQGLASSELSEVAAKVNSFVSRLKDFADSAKTEKGIIDWLDYAIKVTHELMVPAYNDDYGFKRIISKLERLKEQVASSGFEGKVEFSLFKYWALKQIEEVSASSGGFGHGISVSTYVPNRSIPFKFVAILGFNEGGFPRKAIRPSYDLIHNKPLPGDRILKEDDSYLFYQLLQSAQEYLHISYLGQSLNSDSKQLPTILLQQLIDMLIRSGLAEKNLIQLHKLHGFNKLYFSENNKAFSISNAIISNKIYNEIKEITPLFGQPLLIEEITNIDLSELISYYQKPSKFIANRLLNISEPKGATEILDREPFASDNLEKHYVKNAITLSFKEEVEPILIQEFYQASGLLPQKMPGEMLFDELYGELLPLKDVLTKYKTEEKMVLEAKVEIAGLTLHGVVPEIYGNECIHIRPGSMRGEHLIQLWINHLFLNMSHPEIDRSVLFYVDKTKVKQVFFRHIENASEHLTELIEQFKRGCTEPLEFPFLPKSMLAYAIQIKKEKDIDKAVAKALGEWNPNQFNTFAEGADYFNQLIWRGIEPPSHSRFAEIAEEIWFPVLKSKVEAEV